MANLKLASLYSWVVETLIGLSGFAFTLGFAFLLLRLQQTSVENIALHWCNLEIPLYIKL